MALPDWLRGARIVRSVAIDEQGNYVAPGTESLPAPVSETISTLNAALTLDVAGVSSVGVQITRTAGTIAFEVSLDNINWTAVSAYLTSSTGNAAPATTSSTAGTSIWQVSVAGVRWFRARVSSAGANAVTIRASDDPLAPVGVYATVTGSVGVSSLPVPSKLGTTSRQPVWASGAHLVTSATSAKTAALTATEVLISCSTDCYINIGTQSSVVATKGAGSMFLKAGGPYLFQLTSGQGVAAIQDTAAGVVSVIPVA